MALPTYNKEQRRKTFTQLPKGAYVIRIMDAREEPNKNNSGRHIKIAFDIAEGDYKGFYQEQFDRNTNEDKKWPNDALFYLAIPENNSPAYVFTNWNTFFADLEDSNNGFVFGGDVKTLKGKVVGGKFHIEQTEGNNGNIYDHTRLRWTCVADDVRNGKAGRLPNDKLISGTTAKTAPAAGNDFMNIPDGAGDEIPF